MELMSVAKAPEQPSASSGDACKGDAVPKLSLAQPKPIGSAKPKLNMIPPPRRPAAAAGVEKKMRDRKRKRSEKEKKKGKKKGKGSRKKKKKITRGRGRKGPLDDASKYRRRLRVSTQAVGDKSRKKRVPKPEIQVKPTASSLLPDAVDAYRVLAAHEERVESSARLAQLLVEGRDAQHAHGDLEFAWSNEDCVIRYTLLPGPGALRVPTGEPCACVGNDAEAEPCPACLAGTCAACRCVVRLSAEPDAAQAADSSSVEPSWRRTRARAVAAEADAAASPEKCPRFAVLEQRVLRLEDLAVLLDAHPVSLLPPASESALAPRPSASSSTAAAGRRKQALAPRADPPPALPEPVSTLEDLLVRMDRRGLFAIDLTGGSRLHVELRPSPTRTLVVPGPHGPAACCCAAENASAKSSAEPPAPASRSGAADQKPDSKQAAERDRERKRRERTAYPSTGQPCDMCALGVCGRCDCRVALQCPERTEHDLLVHARFVSPLSARLVALADLSAAVDARLAQGPVLHGRPFLGRERPSLFCRRAPGPPAAGAGGAAGEFECDVFAAREAPLVPAPPPNLEKALRRSRAERRVERRRLRKERAAEVERARNFANRTREEIREMIKAHEGYKATKARFCSRPGSSKPRAPGDLRKPEMMRWAEHLGIWRTRLLTRAERSAAWRKAGVDKEPLPPLPPLPPPEASAAVAKKAPSTPAVAGADPDGGEPGTAAAKKRTKTPSPAASAAGEGEGEGTTTRARRAAAIAAADAIGGGGLGKRASPAAAAAAPASAYASEDEEDEEDDDEEDGRAPPRRRSPRLSTTKGAKLKASDEFEDDDDDAEDSERERDEEEDAGEEEEESEAESASKSAPAAAAAAESARPKCSCHLKRCPECRGCTLRHCSCPGGPAAAAAAAAAQSDAESEPSEKGDGEASSDDSEEEEKAAPTSSGSPGCKCRGRYAQKCAECHSCTRLHCSCPGGPAAPAADVAQSDAESEASEKGDGEASNDDSEEEEEKTAPTSGSGSPGCKCRGRYAQKCTECHSCTRVHCSCPGGPAAPAADREFEAGAGSEDGDSAGADSDDAGEEYDRDRGAGSGAGACACHSKKCAGCRGCLKRHCACPGGPAAAASAIAKASNKKMESPQDPKGRRGAKRPAAEPEPEAVSGSEDGDEAESGKENIPRQPRGAKRPRATTAGPAEPPANSKSPPAVSTSRPLRSCAWLQRELSAPAAASAAPAPSRPAAKPAAAAVRIRRSPSPAGLPASLTAAQAPASSAPAAAVAKAAAPALSKSKAGRGAPAAAAAKLKAAAAAAPAPRPAAAKSAKAGARGLSAPALALVPVAFMRRKRSLEPEPSDGEEEEEEQTKPKAPKRRAPAAAHRGVSS
eukprot:tig00021012_g16997.t1